jgi:hypothetical protein
MFKRQLEFALAELLLIAALPLLGLAASTSKLGLAGSAGIGLAGRSRGVKRRAPLPLRGADKSRPDELQPGRAIQAYEELIDAVLAETQA